MVPINNFLKAYASIFDYLNVYVAKPSNSSSFISPNLSERTILYCNYMSSTYCKELGIVTTFDMASLYLLGEVYEGRTENKDKTTCLSVPSFPHSNK